MVTDTGPCWYVLWCQLLVVFVGGCHLRSLRVMTAAGGGRWWWWVPVVLLMVNDGGPSCSVVVVHDGGS